MNGSITLTLFEVQEEQATFLKALNKTEAKVLVQYRQGKEKWVNIAI